MLVQFSLNSAEARQVLARGFWQWPVAVAAKRIVVCRSSTGAALMLRRWPDFPWESFAAGVTTSGGVTVLRRPAPEAVVEGANWRGAALTPQLGLGPDDLIVKSANVYDGQRAGVLLGHSEGFGTMGRIYPGLADGRTDVRPLAPVAVPMLTEKLVPPSAMQPQGYPDAALGWPSRYFVYRPDHIFDELAAIGILTGGVAYITGRGASLDGYSVTTYHVELPSEAAAAGLRALLAEVKGTGLPPFEHDAGTGGGTERHNWGGPAVGK